MIMAANAILLDPRDNVVTVVKEIRAGETVAYRKEKEICTLTAAETIPYCHKIALTTLDRDHEVIKYGELIGKTSETIQKGHWVSHLNIYSVPRNYEQEFVKEGGEE